METKTRDWPHSDVEWAISPHAEPAALDLQKSRVLGGLAISMRCFTRIGELTLLFNDVLVEMNSAPQPNDWAIRRLELIQDAIFTYADVGRAVYEPTLAAARGEVQS
jgi:hypothetical protein